MTRRFKPITTDGEHFPPYVIIDQKKPWLVFVRRKILPDFDGHQYTVEIEPLETVLDLNWRKPKEASERFPDGDAE